MLYPKVSIIIPTFNRSDLLVETLKSISDQTYENWECIIVDDGSTDDTSEIVKQTIFTDKRFKYYNRPNNKPKGANACRNYGFQLSKGDFIKFFDSDDLMKPELIKKQTNFLINRVELDFCATFWIHLYSDGSTMKNKQNTDNYIENPIKAYLLDNHIFPTPSPLWRRSFLEGKVLFDESLHRSQEADFHFKMLMQQPKYDFLHDFLMYIRIGHQSIKTEVSIKSKKSVFKYFNNVFSLVDNSNNEDKRVILEYVFYRQSVNYYNLIRSYARVLSRLRIFREYFPLLFKYSKGTGISRRIKLFFGQFLLIFFGKGYSFFYYPEFNHRKAK